MVCEMRHKKMEGGASWSKRQQTGIDVKYFTSAEWRRLSANRKLSVLSEGLMKKKTIFGAGAVNTYRGVEQVRFKISVRKKPSHQHARINSILVTCLAPC